MYPGSQFLYKSPVNLVLSSLRSKPENFWTKRGEIMALSLFHDMARRVPAYKDFLKKNKINSSLVRNISDFRKLPTIDKKNYLYKYSPKDLSWDGIFDKRQWVISTTSGSTGEPFYFPRTNYQDEQYALTAELYLVNYFAINKKSTLYIVGFPMGAWIGGVFTYQALKILSKRGGYPLSIITPGINKQEIINIIKRIGDRFDQIIIGSYGPFLKDIIDEGLKSGLKWNRYNIGFIFSAEVFNEQFRNFVLKSTRKDNIYKATLNHYGSVDLGTMSHETPLSILIRRSAIRKKKLYKDIFSQTDKLPTLTQYFPEMFYFEQIEDGLICSAYSGYPLVRYDLHDYGGVISKSDIHKVLKDNGLRLDELIRKSKIEDTVWNLPFAYVYERKDMSVSFFGFQIYPETIRKALWHKKILESITGKFTLRVGYDKNINQYLELNIELSPRIKASKKLEDRIREEVIKRLLSENSSYRRTSEEYPKRTVPKIVFWPYEGGKYFKQGVKQIWTEKNH